ncbi:probable disease resistance protein At5g45440 [Abrus precatorius]|uniref:Probable disease resistance protein At5g45440 n=1 Tax=Abrus precatorius TaxID=3816 RepID=A0A8B8KD54_ABRPR|nr:probable disease resistance protein At5g45440 [Abrus precatorius]
MASDIAQFLKQNFLDSFQERALNLSPSVTSLLNAIKQEFEDNKVYWSPPPSESLFCMYQLDYALNEFQTYKTTLSPFSRPEQENDPKIMLGETKRRLIEIREKSQEDANSSLFTSSMFQTTDDSSYFPAFDEEISMILKWLESNDRGFKAIGIDGMCGTGKTKLVERVLEDPLVKGKYEKPIWVSLFDLTSKEEMDIRIVKELLACLNEDPDLLTEEPEDDWLVNKLNEKLKAQKYLIVLDGVWHCNDWFSDLYVEGQVGDRTKLLFSQALPKDAGGAVFVTSRIKEVTKQLVGEKNLIHLKPWSDEKMKEFVKRCMASQSKSNEPIPQEEIDYVAFHCHGLPLVAATLSDWIANQKI